jgi:hypothetical protein
MNDYELDEMKKLLKEALPPIGEDGELRRDLWPGMLRRLDERTMRVPWWDWALLAGMSLVLLIFPRIIPALLYQL